MILVKENIRVGLRIKNIFPASYKDAIGTITSYGGNGGAFYIQFDDGRKDSWGDVYADRFEIYVPDDCS